MPDTTSYIVNGHVVPYDSLPPDIKAIINDVNNGVYSLKTEHSNGPYLLALGVVLLIAFIIVRMIKLLSRDEQESYTNNSTTGNNNQPSSTGAEQKEYYVYEGNKLGLKPEDITNIIIKHYPFYNRLWPTVQYRFQQRLFHFIAVTSLSILK